MINFRHVLFYVPLILWLHCLLLFSTTIVALVYNEHPTIYFSYTILLLISTFILKINMPKTDFNLSIKEGFLITNLAWVMNIILGSMTYYYHIEDFSIFDAIFETISGFTTCGASIIKDPQKLSYSMRFFRMMTQFMGGIGFVVVAIAIFPNLKVGGMQFFTTENNGHRGKLFPHLKDTVIYILKIYLTIYLFCCIGLKISGLGWFDAITHAMAATATGGFANYSNSIAYFNNLSVEIIIIITMLLSSIPYFCYYQLIHQKFFKYLIKDEQIKIFIMILLFIIYLISLFLSYNNNLTISTAIRYSIFNVTSTITTTGFSTENFLHWGHFPATLLLTCAIIGGNSGSTNGGLKIYRIKIFLSNLKVNLSQMFMQYQILLVKHNGRTINDKIIKDTLMLVGIFFITLFISILLFTFNNIDITSALTIAISTLTNSGFSINDNNLSISHFAELDNTSKIVCSFLMYLGRLEFFTFLILLNRQFWRK